MKDIEKIKLLIAQSAPFDVIKLWENADFEHLEKGILKLLESKNRFNQEVCICSAIKFLKEGKEVIIRGHRHCDCFRNVALRPDKEKYKQTEQGFITSKNRFVGRIEGLELQESAGIWSANHGAPYGSHLSSEDLY